MQRVHRWSPQLTTVPSEHSATCDLPFEKIFAVLVMLQSTSFDSTVLVSPPSAQSHLIINRLPSSVFCKVQQALVQYYYCRGQ